MINIKKKKTKNYVNNKDFLDALIQYQLLCKKAIVKGEEKPRVPKYIGDCFYQICYNMSKKPNFSNYPFVDDMVMDGIEDCLKYMHNFSEEKSTNPFSYFSQYAWNAFIRRIKKEKKQMYVKFKSSHDLITTGGTFSGGEDMRLYLNTNLDYINTFIEDFEETMHKSSKEEE